MFSADQEHLATYVTLLLIVLLTLSALTGCGEAGSGKGDVSTPALTTQQTPKPVSQTSPSPQIDPQTNSSLNDQGPSVDSAPPPEPSQDAQNAQDAQGVQLTASALTSSVQSTKPTSTPDELKGEPKPKPTKPKKPKRCQRGIHKGRPSCLIKRNHINIRHINRGVSRKDIKLIDEKRNITKEGRKEMLALLGDWREKVSCGYGYRFNYKYKGRASWRMYDCYVQDRLLWYLYLVGHHFDSEIQIVSGLRSKERKTSRHHNGHAVDFRVAGVNAKKVWEFCKKTFPLVGIGYYPTTHFVHLDVGRDSHQAYWVDKSGSGEDALYKSGVSQEQRGRARKSQVGMIKSIKRSLSKHYQRFTVLRDAWLKRQKQRERAAKRRAAKKAAKRKAAKKKAAKKKAAKKKAAKRKATTKRSKKK